MNDHAAGTGAAGSSEAARSSRVSGPTSRRRLAVDLLSRRVVVLGGLTIIASIMAILIVIVMEMAPLFRRPEATLLGSVEPAAPARPLVAGVDEYREVVFFLDDRGRVQYSALKGQPVQGPSALPGLDGARPVCAAGAGADRYVVGTSDGRLVRFRLRFEVLYGAEERSVHPILEPGEGIVIDEARSRPIVRVAYSLQEEGEWIAAQTGPDEIVLLRVVEKHSLIGGVSRETTRRPLRPDLRSPITALAIDERGENLFAGTAAGQVLRFDLGGADGPRIVDTIEAASRPGFGISVLSFLLGDRTLIVGDRAGGVGSWQVVGGRDGGPERMAPVHRFEPHQAAVVACARSRRDKGFVTADASGTLKIHYGTSGETSLSLGILDDTPATVIMAPKVDGVLALSERGGTTHWAIDNPHPEVTLGTLFGKVLYEGYEESQHVWQSTGGTDDFEPKFGLTPLIFGTLKGTFYALLFAVPIALLGALYTSQFLHPSVRGVVKPVIEVMAALPSVVLGFLAGLWLAPAIERVVPGLFLLPWVLAGLIFAAVLLWRCLPASISGRPSHGSELALLVPIVLLGFWISTGLGGIVERTLLRGDYRGWLLEFLGLTFDQRNSIVVGIAMGFAVIPIIFTIAEDSLSNVPKHLTAGSLALGATRWQTALKIVLPTASPGIFSAIMIGFGRAVGETMIVLMATGNTPIMEWSVFNGFRALSANIAVELPEAPAGGTLFRVLFLAAFLLFAMTFAVNTAAEVVRLKLRQRYRYL